MYRKSHTESAAGQHQHGGSAGCSVAFGAAVAAAVERVQLQGTEKGKDAENK